MDKYLRRYFRTFVHVYTYIMYIKAYKVLSYYVRRYDTSSVKKSTCLLFIYCTRTISVLYVYVVQLYMLPFRNTI